jgi:hypothetical protein
MDIMVLEWLVSLVETPHLLEMVLSTAAACWFTLWISYYTANRKSAFSRRPKKGVPQAIGDRKPTFPEAEN